MKRFKITYRHRRSFNSQETVICAFSIDRAVSRFLKSIRSSMVSVLKVEAL